MDKSKPFTQLKAFLYMRLIDACLLVTPKPRLMIWVKQGDAWVRMEVENGVSEFEMNQKYGLGNWELQNEPR